MRADVLGELLNGQADDISAQFDDPPGDFSLGGSQSIAVEAQEDLKSRERGAFVTFE